MSRSFVFTAIGLVALVGLVLFLKRPTEENQSKHESPSSHGHAHKHEHAEPVDKGVISLDVCSNGKQIHMLIGRTGQPATMEYSSSSDGITWSTALPISNALPAPHRIRRGNDARIVAFQDHVMAVWFESGTGWGGGGPLVTAISSDSGKTWTRGSNPADDKSTGGHSYVAVAADPSGRFHMAWLDSRSGHQGLRYSNSSDFGKTWTANVTIDDETCECCWNSIVAVSEKDIAVLYRDKNPRDMHVAKSIDGGKTWSSSPAGAFQWSFNGCPEVGGGVCGLKTATGVDYQSVIWTGDTAKRGVYFVSSTDGNKSVETRIGPPIASRPDLCTDEAGVMVAAYSARGTDTNAVFAVKSKDRGQTWSEPLKLSKDNTFADCPRAVHTSTGFFVFWTESKSGVDTTWNWRKFEE